MESKELFLAADRADLYQHDDPTMNIHSSTSLETKEFQIHSNHQQINQGNVTSLPRSRKPTEQSKRRTSVNIDLADQAVKQRKTSSLNERQK